jgi:glutaryl-CoA dehydrogenase
MLDSLQEIFGGNAASDEYHIGRHVANLFVVQTYEGQSDIHGKCLAIPCMPNLEGWFFWADKLIICFFLDSSDSGPSHYWQAGLCLRWHLGSYCTTHICIFFLSLYTGSYKLV